MSAYLGEFIGTMLLVLLGNGVVANVVLNKSKGQNSGWMVIATGWGFAVFIALFIAGGINGIHINPAVTIGFATAGLFKWSLVTGTIIAQFLGAMVGSVLVWLMYKQHFNETKDGEEKRAVFCTAPAIRNTVSNVLTEAVATFVLVFGAMHIRNFDQLGSLSALPAGILVWAIVLSLGGPTGAAINPARDLGPRIMHALLPMKHKADSDWSYSWIPVIGPIVGGLLAAFIYTSGLI